MCCIASAPMLGLLSLRQGHVSICGVLGSSCRLITYLWNVHSSKGARGITVISLASSAEAWLTLIRKHNNIPHTFRVKELLCLFTVRVRAVIWVSRVKVSWMACSLDRVHGRNMALSGCHWQLRETPLPGNRANCARDKANNILKKT